ncbi:MAG: hypothetical protein DRI01_04530 [Chloroflexi bacterium]|nr:MAG: hypothetical protein DRI01_04530 [Chloroflexota bacterium]
MIDEAVLVAILAAENKKRRFELKELEGDKLIVIRDRPYSGYMKVFESNRPGKLKEMSIIVDTNDFEVRLIVDGFLAVGGRFEDLKPMSPYVESIDAFEDNGKYIVKISNVAWRQRATCDMTMVGSGRIIALFARYSES